MIGCGRNRDSYRHMPSRFSDRIGSDGHGGTSHLQNLQMTVSNHLSFSYLRSRHNDVSSRFVRNILSELTQHTHTIELNPRHNQHEEDRDRECKLDDMGTASG